MLATPIVATMESILAALQASRLEAMRLQAAIETGYAVQANFRLLIAEMLADAGRAAIGDAWLRDESHRHLKAIICNHLRSQKELE